MGEREPTDVVALRRELSRFFEHDFLEALSATHAAIAVDLSRGMIVNETDQAPKLFGYPTLIGLPLNELVPDPFRDAHSQWLAEYRAHPEVKHMGRRRVAIEGRRVDGSKLPLFITLAPDPRSTQQALAHIITAQPGEGLLPPFEQGG